LREEVTKLVEAHMTTKDKLAGMTVAVTRNGKLLLTAGFGHADIEKGRLMLPTHRSALGSTTKATVTVPTAFKVLQSKGMDPKTKRVYGPSGVLGTAYDDDMQIGIARHTPIAAIAIDPEDRVHAYYTDGTVSSGSTSDLDQYIKPREYKLPPGKRPVDIRSIAFASDGRAIVWYENGTVSIGTITELDRHLKLPVGDEEKDTVKFPPGKSMSHVVGIGIAKSNDRVYVLYEDSTVSSGTLKDFTVHGSKDFDPGPGRKAWQIRDIEISKEGRFYAWFIDDKASSGNSQKLDAHHAPYAYSFPARPDAPDWKAWYGDITLQHLFDHRAGFTRSGDELAAAKMFGTDEADLTYRKVHEHFLRTRKLLDPPGAVEHYSNQGPGLVGHMLEVLTGTPFRQCVRSFHLDPLGLGSDVVPMGATYGPCISIEYEQSGGGLKPRAAKASGLGLAAGGYRASAQSVAKIMASADSKYTDAELDAMGWFRGERGKLWHNGAGAGGMSFAVMFPAGFTSLSGLKLGGIHVVIAVNTGGDVGALSGLADKIALAVPGAGVPKPGQCAELRAKRQALDSEIEDLEQALQTASPGAKGPLAAQIKALQDKRKAVHDQAVAIDCCDP
jgi:CubicO group peptidase (beta-lactamase class C family)